MWKKISFFDNVVELFSSC